MITIEDFEKAIGQLGIVQHDNSSEREVAEKCFELAKQYASSSSEKGDRKITCKDCSGNGQVPFEHDFIECEACDGAGKISVITHQSSKQFSLEDVNAICDVFKMNKDKGESVHIENVRTMFKKWITDYAPKEPSEGEEFEDEEACARCGAAEGHYAYCPDYTNDPNP